MVHSELLLEHGSFYTAPLNKISKEGAMNVLRTLEHGDKFPYDAPDAWWRAYGEEPPPPRNWAHRAARGVLADLTDRRDIKRGFENVDEDIRAEIVDTLAVIIQAAKELQEIDDAG